MKLSQLRYQCDNCGLCCTRTLVKCGPIDLAREPRLQELRRIKLADGTVTNEWLLNREDPNECGCRFHTGTQCSIYPTRPNVCVGFQAGNEDCQGLRKGAGLPPLEPVPAEWEENYVELEMLTDE